MQKLSRLKIAILLTTGIFLLEVAGSLITNSMALLSDAVHMLTDVVALIISASALVLARRKPDLRRTYGFHRVEIFAALVNGLVVILIAFFILYEAYERILTVEQVASFEMLLIAVAGLCTNAAVLKILGHSDDLNVKGAYLHVLGDMLSSIAVVCGAVLIVLTGIMVIDPLLSIGISVIIIYSAGRLVKEAVDILLEKAPKHINTPGLLEEMRRVEGVVEIHDVRLWSVCSNVAAMSAHVVVRDMKVSETERIIEKLNAILEKHGIFITTFQLECRTCGKDVVCGIDHCGRE
ncbi:MAG: cation diffusion facilitator family transporter [Thermoplasmata archaeon]|nr:cation diffusion facilitator family transporter [Thermoplasmata archaeon]